MSNSAESSQFFDRFLFTKIFQTFRIAIHPSKLIIAFLAVVIICLAGLIMDINETVVVSDGTNELQVYLDDPEQLASFIELNEDYGERTGVFSTLWAYSTARFQGAVDSLLAANILGVSKNIAGYFMMIGWALKYHFIYSVIFFIIKLAVICLAGGAICRISALQIARGEKPGMTEAIRYSTKKFISFLTAPLAPVGISIFLGLCILLLGLFGNIPRVGELIMAIGIILALIAGTLITTVLIGTIAGFNLMFPAVAYDGSDCFDAISRSFSYVYSKPWHMGFYTIIAGIYGSICYMFVRFFAFLLLFSTHWFLKLGVFVETANGVDKLAAIWPEPKFMNFFSPADLATANSTETIAAFIINIFVLIIIGLVVSFVTSFYFSANTVIYSLMRNKVDNTAFEEVHTSPEEIESIGSVVETESKPEQSEKKS